MTLSHLDVHLVILCVFCSTEEEMKDEVEIMKNCLLYKAMTIICQYATHFNKKDYYNNTKKPKYEHYSSGNSHLTII